MSAARPQADCALLPFAEAHPMDEPSEVALEDYARVTTRARAAEAMRGDAASGLVSGVHVCGLPQPVTAAIARDVEDFARSLAVARPGGLGWS
jgi:hypothetical protein